MPNIDVSLTLIGGPTLLIEIAGVRFLTDPTFDPPSRYDSAGIVLEKLAGPAIAPEDIGPVDAVLLSHDQHFDNFDRAGRTFLSKVKTTFTTPSGGERWVPAQKASRPGRLRFSKIKPAGGFLLQPLPPGMVRRALNRSAARSLDFS